MTRMTIDSAVTVDGREDTTQLEVQGHTTQTAPLQEWQDAGGDALAKVSGDGRVQVGNFAIDPPPPSALVEANDDITLPSSRPKRAWQSLGKLTGALSEAVAWVAHELRLLGSGEVTGLHAALRSLIRHDKSGVTSDDAELRAGDFLAANDAGTVGKVVGVKAAIQNSGTINGNAVGLQASLENSGSIAGEFYALDAGGPIQIVEQSDAPDAEASGKGVVYAKDDGTLHYKSFGGFDYDLTETFSLVNDSGATAAVGDVGHFTRNGKYKTVSVDSALRSWCVVTRGGANGSTIQVKNRGILDVAYAGDAPQAGDFLVTSATAGRAKRESLLRPEIFAYCLEAGSGGKVKALLLTQRAMYSLTHEDYYEVDKT